MRQLLWTICIVLASLCFYKAQAQAQQNSRNWVNIQSNMVGGTNGTLTTTAFSAFNSISPFKYFSLAVAPQITTAAYSVKLQGSNDNIAWSDLVTASSLSIGPSGGVVFQSSAEPVLYLRLSTPTINSGDKITATAVGVP